MVFFNRQSMPMGLYRLCDRAVLLSFNGGMFADTECEGVEEMATMRIK